MDRKIAILQPNYIPWKGTFDLINRVDVFVFYDDVQYTVKDWRNRNKIKTQHGEKWLSVPVIHKGRREQLIHEAEIDPASNWQQVHHKAILHAYLKAPFFKMFEYLLDEIYLNHKWFKIADLDIFATQKIAEALGIEVQWARSKNLCVSGRKDGEKAIRICKEFQCCHFINGPASRPFMNEQLFHDAGIKLEYMDYAYDEYPQLYPPFNHFVTVLDVLFNCGKHSRKYIFKD